jgi:hypothetical protein
MTPTDIQNLPNLPAQFGPIKQVAYIVNDIEASIAHWRGLNVGPFLITRNVSPLQNAYYRGQKARKTPVHIAFGYIGDLQIELIEPLDNARSLYTEAKARELSGVHHYAICVEDFPEQYNFALDNGYEAVVDSGVDGLARMSYVENPTTGIILEMIEWNDLTRPYFDAIYAMWKDAEIKSEDKDFNLNALTPKGAVLKALGGFLVKKLTGQIKLTRRTT